jgi:hypothetical protein
VTRIPEEIDDDAFQKLYLHCKVYAAACARTEPRCGPFVAPRAAFVGREMNLEPWSPLSRVTGATYGDLIDVIRDEARARSAAGSIIGAALVVKLENPSGRVAIGIQVHTHRSKETFVLPIANDGVSLGAPQSLQAIVPGGLGSFPSNVR